MSPPFFPNSKNRIGYWDICGTTQIFEDNIILTPPIPMKKGSAWCTLPLPWTDWAIHYTLKLNLSSYSPTLQSGFAAWIIEKFAADGPLYGGPSSFKGLAAVVGIISNKLHLKIYQSNETAEFKCLQPSDVPDAVFDLPSSQTFDFSIGINKKNKSVFIEFDSETVYETPLSVDISKSWTGLTALSGEIPTRIDLLEAMYDIAEFEPNDQHSYIGPQSPDIPSKPKLPLRNPAFSVMLNQTLERDTPGNEANISIFMATMSEFAEVLSRVETYSQLGDFVQKTMLPYMQRWQSRTYKIMERIQNVTTRMNETIDGTKALVEIFSRSMFQMAEKTDQKLVNLSDVIEETVETAMKEANIDVSQQIQIPMWMTILKYVSIVEVFGLVAFYFAQRHPAVLEKFIY